jgi:hypothetical protein
MTTAELERAFDDLLAGRNVSAEVAPLAVFTEGVRAFADRPARPNSVLTELLATGLLPASGTEIRPTVTRRRATTAAPPRRRRSVFALLATAVAKITSLSAATQAAAGLGIALASVTAAGATGVLPNPIQDPVASVIESVTPFDLPDSADAASATTDKAADEVAPQEDGSPSGSVESPDRPVLPEQAAGHGQANLPDQAQFGASVSQQAQAGTLSGPDVSTQAREAHQPETPAAAASGAGSDQQPPVQPETGRPETVPAPAPQGAEHVPAQAGRP